MRWWMSCSEGGGFLKPKMGTWSMKFELLKRLQRFATTNLVVKYVQRLDLECLGINSLGGLGPYHCEWQS